MVEARADAVGTGSEANGGGIWRRVWAVMDLRVRVDNQKTRKSTHLSVNCNADSAKRNIAIGPQTMGTTHHLVRVKL